MCVSLLPPRLLITSGMMWCDMNQREWLSSTVFIWRVYPILLVDIALEMKRIIETNLISAVQVHYFHCKSPVELVPLTA